MKIELVSTQQVPMCECDPMDVIHAHVDDPPYDDDPIYFGVVCTHDRIFVIDADTGDLEVLDRIGDIIKMPPCRIVTKLGKLKVTL